MERYSKPTKAFIESLSEKQIPEAGEQDLKDVVRAAKLISRPEKIPKALIAYGTSKIASQITEEINPIDLKEFLLENYGVEWLDWVPEVLDEEILKDQKSEILSNKMQALRVCLTTDTPWLEWHIFENVGKAFNHQVPNFGLLQPLSVGECLTTMETMKELREEEEFSNEVLIYIATVAATNHLVYLPEGTLLAKAQDHLDGLTNNPFLKVQVSEAWGKAKGAGKRLLQASYDDENPVHMQLANLAFIQQYVEEY